MLEMKSVGYPLLVRRIARAAEKDEQQPARAVFMSMAALSRQRKLLQALLTTTHGLGLSGLLPLRGNKRILWQIVSKPQTIAGQDRTDASKTLLQSLLLALSQTSAWDEGMRRLQDERWNSRQRIKNHESLSRQLCAKNPHRIFFWHHHDNRGYLPKSWQEALVALADRGWTVVVSSSTLRREQRKELEQRDLLCCERVNKGLCIGAYKDFCILLEELLLLRNPSKVQQLGQLFLANDSTLPITGANQFADYLEELQTELETSRPCLAGATDSIERGFYHLQSYLIRANRQTLQRQEWNSFWNRLRIASSKDEAIDEGEIGLSQAMLKAGIKLRTKHSLLRLISRDPKSAEELNSYGIHKLDRANPTLFAWNSLLRDGFPLLKKQLALGVYGDENNDRQGIERAKQVGSIASAEAQEDLQQLLQSRFMAL